MPNSITIQFDSPELMTKFLHALGHRHAPPGPGPDPREFLITPRITPDNAHEDRDGNLVASAPALGVAWGGCFGGLSHPLPALSTSLGNGKTFVLKSNDLGDARYEQDGPDGRILIVNNF
jgi:hypothetical protein